MTYLGGKYIDICSKTTVVTHTAENRGQKVFTQLNIQLSPAVCSF